MHDFAEFAEAREHVDDGALKAGSVERALIRQLRDEAYDVKDCFTRYSFYAISAIGPVLLLIARFEVDLPFVALLSVLPVIALFSVLSMGIHKYATANRLLGYQLHLERMQHFGEKWRRHMDASGWEEIMRAWRIIQATLLARIYQPRSGWPRFLVPRQLRSRLCHITTRPHSTQEQPSAPVFANGESWFDQRQSVAKVPGAIYDSGGYLQTHKFVFLLMMVSCFSLASIALIHGCSVGGAGVWVNGAALAFLVGSVAIAAALWVNVWSKIDILENGAGSIHSCSIIWEATMMAHLQSLKQLGFFGPGEDEVKTLHGYTNLLAHEAASIANYAWNIHEWIYLARVSFYEAGSNEQMSRSPKTCEGRSVHVEPWAREAFRRGR